MAAAPQRDDSLRGYPSGSRGIAVWLPPLIAAVLMIAPARVCRAGDPFAPGPSIGGPEAKTTGVALGDVDRDGDLDLVRGNYTGRTTLYLNRGGRFDSTWATPAAAATYGVALGDVNGDGQLDLVLGNYQGYSMLYLNDGQGGFAETGIRIGLRAEQTTSVALGDVDNDGDLDLVRGNESQRSTLYLNAGGAFGDTAWSAPVAEATSSVALGDVNGDGDLDLVLGNRGQRGTLYLNSGGTFAATGIRIGPGAEQTTSVAMGDVDSDGDLDLVRGNYGQESTLYLNSGVSFDPAPGWTFAMQKTQAVALADVDGDDDLDLVRGNDAEVAKLDLNLDPPFAAYATSGVSPDSSSLVALGDVDNDGDLDLVTKYLYLNSGGNFVDAPVWTGLPDSTSVVGGAVLGDVDRDGDLDLVRGDPPRLYLNVGGTFSETPADTLLAGGIGGAAHPPPIKVLGDVDGDGEGYLDLVYGNNPTMLCPYIGATFGDTVWAGPWEGTNGLALGDVDGDGHLDLVRANSQRLSTLYLNIGGTFPRTGRGIPRADAQRAELGDLDGDGNLDLVLSGESSNLTTLHLNDGGAFDNTETWTGAAVTALGDVDGDGDLDLVGNSVVYLNELSNGGGFASRAAPPNSRWGLALGDVDGDGDLDVVFQGKPANLAGDAEGAALHLGTSPWMRGGSAAGQLPNNAAHLRWVRVGAIADNRATVTFQAVDVESDPLWVVGEYQLNGRAEWWPLVLDGNPLRTGPFSTAPDAGVAHQMVWDVTQLPFDHREVVIRLRAVSMPRRAGVIQSVPSYLVTVGKVVPARPLLAATPGSLVFPTLTVGDSAQASLELRNTGNQELVISQVETPDAEVVVLGSPPWRLAPQERRTVEILVAPTRGLAGLGPVRIHSNDPVHPVTDVAVDTDVRWLQFTTSIAAALPELPLGEAVGLLVTPEPAVRVERGYVLYRARGATAFTDSAALNARGRDFVALIPGAAVTEAGLEYYVRVENSGVSANDPAAGPSAPYYYPVAAPVGMASVARADPAGDYPSGRAIPVEVRLPQGAVFQAGHVYYRAGGSAVEDSVALEVVELAPGVRAPVGTIPAAAVGPRGVAYRVRVATLASTLSDPPQTSAEQTHGVRTDVSDLAETAGHAGGRYRMVSVPLVLRLAGNATLEALLADDLGTYEPTRWRSFRYLPAEGGYRELSVAGGADGELRPEVGRAFWLTAREAHRIDTAPVTGRSTPTDSSCRIPLAPGWNQVGDPYLFAVAWSSVSAVDAGGAAVTLQPPRAWDEAGGTYRPEDVTVLEPFTGYWVWNPYAGPVELVIPPEEAVAGVAARTQVAAGRGGKSGARAIADATADAAADTSGWGVRIAAACGAVRDVGNLAGVAAEGREGHDALDRSEPPMAPGPALSLHFIGEDGAGERAGMRLTADLRSLIEGSGDPVTHGRRWTFDVVRSAGEAMAPEVSLTFSGLERIPAALEVRLLDRVLKRTIDLRAGAVYLLAGAREGYVAQASEARFELWVGSVEYLAAAERGLKEQLRVTRLLPVFPNPARGWAIVRYETARAGRVTLALYDVAGRRVRTLVDAAREVGLYELVWHGEGEDGRTLPSGVYSLRLVAPERTEVRKLVKLR